MLRQCHSRSITLCWKSSSQKCKIFWCYPVDTGRKFNVHKTFRRRPGRLLNGLCTFNLCPVSTGCIFENYFRDRRKIKSSWFVKPSGSFHRHGKLRSHISKGPFFYFFFPKHLKLRAAIFDPQPFSS